MRVGLVPILLCGGCSILNPLPLQQRTGVDVPPPVYSDFVFRRDGFTTKNIIAEYRFYAPHGVANSCTLDVDHVDKIEIVDGGCDGVADSVRINGVGYLRLDAEQQKEADRVLHKFMTQLYVVPLRKRWEDGGSFDALKKY